MLTLHNPLEMLSGGTVSIGSPLQVFLSGTPLKLQPSGTQQFASVDLDNDTCC